MPSNDSSENGLVTIGSAHSVDATLSRLEQLIEARGLKLFAVVDHSGEAEKVGLRMPNTKLVIFGSPKAGTPLMLSAPSIAIDLPLKLLISEDAEGKVWVTYNRPEYLRLRHRVPADLMRALEGITALADSISAS